MTAKEKVLKVHPGADWTDCAGVWEIWYSQAFVGDYAHRLGHSIKSLRAAWQNAAESLPAAPVCGHSGCKHDNKGCCVCGEPKTVVAPVAAKEKPLCAGGHCPGTGQCMLCAEPKPTPYGEPSESIALPWEPGLTDEIIAIAEKHALTDAGTKAHWMATALALSMKLEEVMTVRSCGAAAKGQSNGR